MEIDDALVDAHLEPVPRLGSLSTGRLPGGDSQGVCGHAHWTLGLELLLFGALDEVVANLLQRLDVARRQGDADAVDGGIVRAALLVLERRLGKKKGIKS